MLLSSLLLILLLALIGPTSGCSVGMALSGKKDPDLSVVRTGASRGEIELQLGKPTQTVTLDNNRRADVYAYEIGNEPSGGRAVAHGVMDVLTLGIWEVVGTPVELAQGDKHQLTIIYDQYDKVEAVNIPPRVPPKPMPGSSSPG